jgi:hypothetical protein
MFIALHANSCALQRSAMCSGRIQLHSAPDGAGYVRGVGAINILLLRSKNPRTTVTTFRAKPPQVSLALAKLPQSASGGALEIDFATV